MQQLKTIDINNPQYLKLSQQQQKLKDDAKSIEDSLFALSKRVVEITPKVNEEISSINHNMDESLDNLEARMVPQARSRQQFVMTSVNNLTLLLSEALQQMQQQQANFVLVKENDHFVGIIDNENILEFILVKSALAQKRG